MPWQIVQPVIDPKVRSLCRRAYPGHPQGCPNFGKRLTCPPIGPRFSSVIDLARPVYAIWNVFDFAGHVAAMAAKHPTWSRRQLACCLYWQGSARKALRMQIRQFLRISRAFVIFSCPEAGGVDLTATMRGIGIELEWPPVTKAYQIVLAGSRQEDPAP